MVLCYYIYIIRGENMKKNSDKKNKKKRWIVFVIILLLIAVVGLFSLKYFKTVDDDSVEISKPKNKEKSITIVDMNSNKRPVAVMIDNNVGNASHIGLQDAYLTYEIIVEGGLTRIMAIFKDKDVPQVGPVRSSRHYFLDYALESDAIYDHYGWSPYAEADIRSLSVNNINGMTVSSAYWRDSKIRAPHNVFTSISKSYDAANTLGYSTTSDKWQTLQYSADSIDLSDTDSSSSLKVANSISVQYSPSQTRQYTYDSEKKVYLRLMNNMAHVDKVSGEQYNYKNLIIEKVFNKTLDSEGRQDLSTVGSGDGYYITNGYALPITWIKEGRGKKTKYKYLDGTEINLNDGNTFIQIIPSIYEVVIN